MTPTPHTCRGCDEPSAEPLHWGCDDPSPDTALLARPGVMRALWWSLCRGCDERIDVGDITGLADLEHGRAWVCRSCLTGPAAGPTTLPRPRQAPTEALSAAHGPLAATTPTHRSHP